MDGVSNTGESPVIKQLFRITQESLLISGNNSKKSFLLTLRDSGQLVCTSSSLHYSRLTHAQQPSYEKTAKFLALFITKPYILPVQCWDRIFWKWSAKLMSTDSWKVFLECEPKDVDCILMGMYKGVHWYKISSENMTELSDRGNEEVMWFATICN